MAVSDIFLHRQVILRRIGQFILACLAFWLITFAAPPDPSRLSWWNTLWAFSIALGLIIWEVRSKVSYRFSTFPERVARWVGRRIGQFILACLAFWLIAFAAPPDPSWLHWWNILLAALAVLVLIIWELLAIASYGLTVFPPGAGTFRPQKDQGVGRFLSLIELASRFRWKPGGIFIGRPLSQHRFFGIIPQDLQIGPVDDRHMLTIAGARAGKATAAIVPNLLRYPGSVLVIDPKGELAQITGARRGKGSARVTDFIGQDVFILDPEDIVDGHPRACWNPLAELNLSNPHLWGLVARISLAIVPDKPGKGEDAFFTTQARDFLTALIMHVLTKEPPERHNLIYVRKLVTQGDIEVFTFTEQECQKTGTPLPFSSPLYALLNYMMENQEQTGKIAGIAQGLIDLAEETRTSIIATLVEQTGFLDHHSMEKTLQHSDFSLGDLKKRPTTVYICLKGTSLAGPLVKVVYLLLELAISRMEEIPGKPPHNVLFVMDEFYCLGRSEAIDRAMGLMAGFGLTLWPILQHTGQLKKHYPDTWDNFVRNCRAVQYFGDQAPDVLQELEKRLGDRVIRKKDNTEERRSFIPYSELASNYFTRESRRQLVFFQQQPAAVLELMDYYKYFPRSMYEEDSRASDRSQYSAWHQP